MPELYCPHCGAGPLANKASLNSHVRYRCKKAPPRPPTLDESDPATITPEGIGVPPVPETPLLGQRSAPVAPEPPPPAASLPFNTNGLSPEEMDRRIAVLVDARVRAALASAEERIGGSLQQAIGMIEETCNKLPSLVEKQVQGILGGEQVVVDQSGAPAGAPPPKAAAAPGLGALGGLGGLLTPELLDIASKLLGAKDATLGSIVEAFIKRGQAGSKTAIPDQTWEFKGRTHMLNLIKNKRSDPKSAAKVTITMSDDYLKLPGLDNKSRSYWNGRKSEAVNYLASLLIDRDDDIAEAAGTRETPPAPPPVRLAHRKQPIKAPEVVVPDAVG